MRLNTALACEFISVLDAGQGVALPSKRQIESKIFNDEIIII